MTGTTQSLAAAIQAIMHVCLDHPGRPGAHLTPGRDDDGARLEVTVEDVDLALDITARLKRDHGGSYALRVDPGANGDRHTYTARLDGLTITVTAVEPAADDALVAGSP